MKTTIDIPKELIQNAKIHAVRNGTSLKEMVIEGLRRQLKIKPAKSGRTLKISTKQDFLATIDEVSRLVSEKSVTNKSLVELVKEGRR